MNNLEGLLITLRNATSQQSEVITPAVQSLKDSEGVPGFYYALLKVGLSSQLNAEVNVRWLAVLYLKNGIERHWRTHGPSPISEPEKNSIRNEILSCFDESVPQIALQFAVIVSKIARYDYPKNWPQLFHVLLSSIENMNPTSTSLRDNTALLTYRYTMKELSSKRLPNDKKIFGQLCSGSYPCVFKCWEHFYKTVIELLQSPPNQQDGSISFLFDNLINLLKSFRCMSPVLASETNLNFFSNVLAGLRTLLGFTHSTLLDRTNLADKFHKLLIVHSKILLEPMELNNSEIFKLTKGILEVCKQCIFIYSESRTTFHERFIVNCMNSIKFAISNEVNVSMGDMQDLLRRLVFSFLPLTPADLECWEDDVEEFCSEDIGETWKYNLRPSTEVLFLTFLHKNPDQLVPIILSTLQTINEKSQQTESSMDIQSILLNDAVYAATGLACNELFDSIDFESWFVKDLSPYVQRCIGHQHGKIVHRRVLWLIEQWMGVKPPNNIRATLYEFIISSLDGSLDMAVRLAASSALRQILDDFEFDIETFAAYQNKCTESLYQLLQDAESGDAKMRVLHVLSFVIERLGTQVSACLPKLANILPSIWLVSESHNMLRCAVITTLINLVLGLKEKSAMLNTFLLNVIHTSTDITSPAHVYLLTDGLDLWITVLHNTEFINDSLLQLFHNIYGLFELSSESLKECLQIVECYAVLGGEEFVGGCHGSVLALAITSLITDVRDECLIIVARLIETVIRVAPSQTPLVFERYLCDTIQHMLNEDADDSCILATARLLVVARLVFHNLQAFWNLMSRHYGMYFNEAVMKLFHIFSNKIDSVVETEQRKVVAMACLSMLDYFAECSAVQASLSHILCITVQVLHDVCDEDRHDTVIVSDATDHKITANEWDNFHSLRMRALIQADPNHKIPLPDFVCNKLENLSTFCGGQERLQDVLTNAVDNNVLEQLHTFIKH